MLVQGGTRRSSATVAARPAAVRPARRRRDQAAADPAAAGRRSVQCDGCCWREEGATHAHLPPHPRSTLLSTRCGSPRVGTAALPRCGDRGRMCRCGWRAPVRQWGCRGWCDSGDRSPQGWGAHVGRFHLGGRHWITVSSIPDSAAGLGVLCMTYTRRTLARRTCMMYLVLVSTVYCTPLRGGLDENLPLTPYTYRCALSPKLSWTYLLFHCLAWPSCGEGG